MTERFLVVRVAGREFALRASRIGGLVQAAGLTIVPREGREPYRYNVSMDGRDISVIVPNGVLCLPERPIGSRTCLILIDGRPEAILVDSVSRFEEIEPVDLRPPDRVRIGNKWRTVLDVDRFAVKAA